jgi:hypothetical protein
MSFGVFEVLNGTEWDEVTAVVWGVIGTIAGYNLLARRCATIWLCFAAAFLSLASFARAFAVWERGAVTPDSLLTGIALLMYFVFELAKKGK